MRRNNKGFSLIELIIVIAIMAVLIAVIAPNLIKYLSKSKEKVDVMNADEIKRIYEQALALTNVEVSEPDASVIDNWTEIREGTHVFNSTATVVGEYIAFPRYIADALEEVPKTKVKGENFKVKITKEADGRYKVEVK